MERRRDYSELEENSGSRGASNEYVFGRGALVGNWQQGPSEINQGETGCGAIRYLGQIKVILY